MTLFKTIFFRPFKIDLYMGGLKECMDSRHSHLRVTLFSSSSLCEIVINGVSLSVSHYERTLNDLALYLQETAICQTVASVNDIYARIPTFRLSYVPTCVDTAFVSA